jgi:hypothetical protein
MSLALVPLGTLSFTLAQTVMARDTPVGTRAVVQFDDVRWEGDRLVAHQRGATSSDWLTVGPEGTASLDMRLALETNDGALIFVQGLGRTDAARFASDGGPMYFAPRFETGDARYAWLNRVQAIGRGMAVSGRATFEMYEVK